MNEKTVYSLAQQRRIPVPMVGGQWRFRRGDLDAWTAAQTAAATDEAQQPAGAGLAGGQARLGRR